MLVPISAQTNGSEYTCQLQLLVPSSAHDTCCATGDFKGTAAVRAERGGSGGLLADGMQKKRWHGGTALPQREEPEHYALASNTDSYWHSAVWGVSWGDNGSQKRDRGRCIVVCGGLMQTMLPARSENSNDR
jgi:hypothetical protein